MIRDAIFAGGLGVFAGLVVDRYRVLAGFLVFALGFSYFCAIRIFN